MAAAWVFLRALPWRWIALALAILALVIGIERYGYSKGRHSRDTEVARITRDRDTYKANAATLQDSLDRQNAAVARLKAEGDKRVQDGKVALARAKRANAGLSEQAEALRKSANRKPAVNEPCLMSETLARVGSI